MEINPFGFYTFSSMAIAFALLVVFKKNPVSSAFSLVMVFFAFAGIYAVFGAHLIAAIQVLVYAGAIMVLFIFVIMLLNADEPSFDMKRSHPVLKVSAGIACTLLFIAFVWTFHQSRDGQAALGQLSVEQIEATGGNSKVIAQLMFTKYLLPFELTSVLLLAAIVGAVAIAKRKLADPATSTEAA
jgi:NADH-quinone oxidoreductase subunit J